MQAKYKRLLESNVHAGVLLHPQRAETYEELFEGYTRCEFIAYNAPFRLEERNKRVFERALDVQLKRYEEEVVSRYLFFERPSYDRAKGFFCKLAERASEKGISFGNKIELGYLGGQTPQYTYFLGYRSGIPRVILYPSATTEGGLPEAVIIVDGDENLRGILASHFQRQWDKARKPGPPSLEVKEHQAGTVTVVELQGRLTSGAGKETLEETLQRLINSGRLALLLECSKVSAIDNEGIAVLLRAYILVEKQGGKLKLLKPSPRMRDSLSFSRLPTVIELYDDEQSALRSYDS